MTRPLRFTFRAKLMSIVGIAGVAFAALVAAGAILGKRVEGELATIQQHYLPKIELGPKLEGELDRLRHSYQDAVAIRDADELTAADDAKRRFIEDIDAAGGAVDPRAAAALRHALDDYCTAATDVSRRLIAGETGEGIVDAVAAMQKAQARVETLLREVAALDRRELAQAFAASTRAVRSANEYQLWIGAVCLGATLLLSLALSRSVLRVVAALAAGLERFGEGNFREPVQVVSHDELGDVARDANHMAASLERLGKERERAELALLHSNRELEAFSYSVAHDLRAPLRGINGFSGALLEDYGDKLGDEGRDYLQRIGSAAERMGELIDALLALARVSRTELRRETVDLAPMADAVMKQLELGQPDRAVEFVRGERVVAYCDASLVRAVLENLLGNSWKFTSTRSSVRIAFGVEDAPEGAVYYVRDNGAGFNMAYADKLFAPFQRLHSAAEFAGTGIGLATVQRIVLRHGGRIWAEGAIGEGAAFYFTLPRPQEGISP